MTTSVDILFKELPTASGPHERKNVSNISSTAPARDSNQAQQSNNIVGNEKSFAEHLQTQPSSTAQNGNDANKNNASSNQEEVPNNDYDVPNDNNHQNASENLVATIQVPPSENRSAPLVVNAGSISGTAQVIVAPTDNAKNKPSLEEPFISSTAQATRAEQNILAGENSSITAQQTEASQSDIYNNALAIEKTAPLILGSQEMLDNAPTQNIAASGALPVSETGQASTKEMGTNNVSLDNPGKSEILQSASMGAPDAVVQNNQDGNSITDMPATTSEQKIVTNIVTEPDNLIPSDKLIAENNTPNNPVTIEMTNALSQQSLQQAHLPNASRDG